MSRVAVAVSGGVDSLCALVLARAEEREVLALHGLFTPESAAGQALPGLERVCAALGVPLHVVDLRDNFFQEVIVPFGQSYADGRTPNPCSLCNKRLKFGALLDAAFALGAEKLATGHYARLTRRAPPDAPLFPYDTPRLYAGSDRTRDQSYFLSLVPAERLGHALFPLGERTKDWCRARVTQAGLAVPLPVSSSDLCFVTEEGPDAHCAYLLSHWSSLGFAPPGPGPILLAGGGRPPREAGTHSGLWRYTEGQRRGIGIAHTEPLYVLAKDAPRNTLIVGGRDMLGMAGCVTGQANFLVGPEQWPERVFARLRYRRKAAPARVDIVEGCLDITLQDAEFPAAPGQLAVIYDEDERVLAGGVIERVAHLWDTKKLHA